MSESDTRVEEGEQCPISYCEKKVEDGDNGHWVAWGSGYSTYHTDKVSVARTWEHRDSLTVVPSTEPFTHTDN